MQASLQNELNDLSHISDPNVAHEKIVEAYSTGIDRYSFTYTPSWKNTPIKPWITPAILASINRKNELFITKSNRTSNASIADYRQYRNILVGVIRE